MKLYLYRVSLTEREQDDLFVSEDRISRKDFLRKHFSRKFYFTPRKGISLRFEFTQEDDEVIAGAVCRWAAEDSDADPADPFATVEGGRWHKAAFFFNIEDHQQIFGIEHNARVASPSSIISGLLDRINGSTDGFPYIMEAAELNKKGSFSEAIASYPGPITSLRFRFVVPNPPDVEKETREALKKLGKRTGAVEAIEILKNPNGLKTSSNYVQDAVEYIEEGGGDVIAKDGNEKIFDSTARVRTADVDDAAMPTGNRIRNLAKFVKGLLLK